MKEKLIEFFEAAEDRAIGLIENNPSYVFFGAVLFGILIGLLVL